MKTHYCIFFFYSVVYFLQSCEAGHIFSQTSEIIPQNANYAKNIHLFFMLETSLVSSDCFYIKFPMSVGTSSASLSQSSDISIPASISTNPFSLNGNSLNDTTFYQLSSAISSNTWYRIDVTLGNLSSQTEGVQGCIWFATTSDYNSNYIVYDENRCFDIISFAPKPDISIFQVTGYNFNSDGNDKTNNFGQNYKVFFDIYPNEIINFPGAKIRLIISQGNNSIDSFVFGNTCSTISCVGNNSSLDYCPSGGISALTNSSCSVYNNTLNLNINQAVMMKPIRISTTIINPNAIATSTISAYYLSQKAELYFAVLNSIKSGAVNGLNLMTMYNSLTIAAKNVLLFWGVSHKDTSTKTNFIGCPIYLYTSNSNEYIIFNSMKTVFTLPSPINSFSYHSYLKAIWTVINFPDAIESFLMNSITTNMPGQILYSVSLASGTVPTIICSGITDLSPQEYQISGKFALARLSSFLSTLIPEPNKPICGGVVITTGTGAKKAVTISGVAIGVKRNIEYYDKGIANVGDGSNKYYNQIYSYWASDSSEYSFNDSEEDIENSLNTFKTKFLGITSGKVATVGAWYKGSSQKTQALLLQFQATPTIICSTSVNYIESITSLCDGTGGANANYAVLLKIVFNNNILQIDKNNFSKGVKKIGTLFKMYSGDELIFGGNNSISNSKDYNWSNGNQSINLKNSIQMDGSFWHLSILCLGQIIDASCYNILPYSGITKPAVSGISFIDTNINTYPTLYSDSKVLDFIICFKLSPYSNYSSNSEANWVLLEEGTTSAGVYTSVNGPGVLNGYVITNSLDNEAGNTRISIVNSYIKRNPSLDSDFGYSNTYIKEGIPSYLRIGFKINKFNGNGSNLAIFLNGEIGSNSTISLAEGLGIYSNKNGNINILDMKSETQISGTFIKGNEKYYSNLNDFWWSHSGFLFPIQISNSSSLDFNFYIPIQTTFKNILSLNIAIMGDVKEKYPLQSIYRIFGSSFSSNILTGSYELSFTKLKNSFTIPTMTANTFIKNYETPWDQGENGCQFSLVNYSLITTPRIGASNSEVILPGKTMSTVYFNSDVIGNSSNSDCNIGRGNSGDNWGSAFIIYGRDLINYFKTATLAWDLAGNSTLITNKCFFHNINYGTKIIYTIFCTVDAGNGVPEIGSGSKFLKLSTFIVPFFWGASFVISQKLTYGWSDIYGRAVLHNPDTTNTSNWYYSSCMVDGLTNLPQLTKDAAFTLTVSLKSVNYALEIGDSLVVELETTQSFVKFCTECNHSNLKCNGTSGFAPNYILTAVKFYVLAVNDPIIINGWVDTDIITSNSPPTYSVNLKYKRSDIETAYPISERCSSMGAILSVTSDKLNNEVLITSLNYINMKSARGTFSFTFKYPRIIRNTYSFILGIGVFGSPTVNTKNYRCLITDNHGNVQNKWLSISTFDSSFQTTIKLKETINQGGSFALKCIGGNSPDGKFDLTSNPIYSFLLRDSGETLTESSTQAKAYVSNLQKEVLSIVTTNKFFIAKGLDSDYTFSFKPINNNITTNGRIYVEFSQCVAPKLNKFGYLSCYLNEIPAFCEFLDERKVSIWPTIPLLITSPSYYNAIITGVTQPFLDSQDSNLKIYFALDQDNDPYNGISEQLFLSDIFDNSSNIIPNIFIHNFNFSIDKIRSKTNITMVINLPLNSISKTGAGIWIQFPENLGSMLFYQITEIQASLIRVFDSTYLNRVRRVSSQKGRRIYIDLINDPENSISALNYTLLLMNILTPQTPSFNYHQESLTLFITKDNISATAISATGSRNTSIYLQFQKNPENILLNWFDENSKIITYKNPLDISIGYYGSKICLTAGIPFKSTWYYTFTKGNTTDFSIQSANDLYPLSVTSGVNDSCFYIGAKKGIYPGGRYFLSATKNGDYIQQYSSLPILDIRPKVNKCTPKVSGSSFEVPYSGGISDPIIVDFSHCPPMDNIIVIGNVSYGFNLTDNNGISFSGAQTQNSTLTFSGIDASYKVNFYVTSNDNSNGTMTDQIGNIVFQIKGTNGEFYNNPTSVSIYLVPSSSIPPNPMQTFLDNSKLSVGCDQKGTNFFVLGLGQSAKNISLLQITSKTLAVNVILSIPDTRNDADYKVYGYITGLTPGNYSEISLKGRLKANGSYSVYSFCMSNNLIANNISTNYSWKQRDNGDKTVIMTIRFIRKLTSFEKLDFACSLSRIIGITSSRIFTDEGKTCPQPRVLEPTRIIENFNQTQSNDSINVTSYSTSFIVVKDYFSESALTFEMVTSKTNKTNFIQDVIYQTSSGIEYFPNSIDSEPLIIILDAFSYTTPIVTYQEPIINTNSVNITFNLTNINGFIYAAIAYDNATIAPDIKQIRNGIDGNGVALIYRYFESVDKGKQLNFNFQPLEDETNYKIFYVGTNLDTSINSITSDVAFLNVTTLKSNKTTSWKNKLGYRSWIIIFFILILILIL